MIKMLIADDHPIFRRGLKELLYDSFDDVTVDEASNSSQALSCINSSDYQIVLLDIAMPGRSGLDIIKDIKKASPKVPVLMLSAYPEDQYAIRALKSGASAYLTKKSIADELIEAIKKVLHGGKYLTSSLAERLAFAIEENNEIIPHEKLSNREYQIMCMIASGKTVKAIADELRLSENTVSTYRIRTLEKMNLKNNAELTYYAVKHGLIE
ncbi:MAG: response regulator transcription factor [Deltaproteobacteria bacterium]|nr:response regulator transcription factor [Deltaproteobacteria bacterium]